MAVPAIHRFAFPISSSLNELQKTAIVAEAARVLRIGGRFGIHELSLKPDNLSGSLTTALAGGIMWCL